MLGSPDRYIPMPPPPLLLVADARSIQLFSSCTGVFVTGGFFGREVDRCAAGWRAWGFLTDAACAQAHGAMTANTMAIAVDRTMRTSTVFLCMIFSENRYPLFGIMHSRACIAAADQAR